MNEVKDELKKYIVGVVIVGIVLLIINGPAGFGFLLAAGSLILLNIFREIFYRNLFELKRFSVGLYISYVLFVFIIVWLPLLLAFMFPKYINPYVMGGVILLDRIRVFVVNYFKERVNVTN